MPELNPRERLQPFLLDRLSDDQSDQAKESRDKYVFSMRQLKSSLMRDLAWLLNTAAPTADEGLEEFPAVMTSVINYGIPDLTGQTASSLESTILERGIVKAIQAFEPRLEKRGMSVRLVKGEATHAGNSMALEIKAEVVANPLPDTLYIKTEVDLETGQFEIKDRPNG